MRYLLRFVGCASALALALKLLLLAGPAQALVNPSLQPMDLAEQYELVFSARVTELDGDQRRVELAVETVTKGELDAERIVLEAEEDQMRTLRQLPRHQLVVAYVSATGRRGGDRVLYYAGDGHWHQARLVDEQDPTRWRLLGDADADEDAGSDQIMFGTFNGRADRLLEMMQDYAAGRMYFPPRPFERFEGGVIDQLEAPLQGVGLHDLNGDGRLDGIATSQTGSRVYLQDEAGSFTDATERLGLADTASRSCSVGDVDGDGRPDLLLDARIYLASDTGSYELADLLPGGAGEGLLSAAFVDLNGDGWPDVVASYRDGGLRAYMHPGERGEALEDRSEALGLRSEMAGATLTGYFEPCDWDRDGRADLLHAAGAGTLLWQNDDGTFDPVPLDVTGASEPRDFGAPASGPLWSRDTYAFFVPLVDANLLIARVDQLPADVTHHGNEIQESAHDQLMALAEDLNADGTVDAYIASRSPGSKGFYVMNRGYGSFLMSEKYSGGPVFPASVYRGGVQGLAAGDVNGDGAADLLVGGLDGTLTLCLNRSLDNRYGIEHPRHHQRKRMEARLVSVRLTGDRGLTGAEIAVEDPDTGEPVMLRRTGGNVGVGCAGPAGRVLAVREPGVYRLVVRFSDGRKTERDLDLTSGPQYRVIEVNH